MQQELQTLRLKLKAARRLIRDLEQAAAEAEKAIEQHERIAETEAERDRKPEYDRAVA